MYTFDDYATALEKTTMRAVSEWLAAIDDELYPPALTAAADTMPALDVLLFRITAWVDTADRFIRPAVIGVIAAEFTQVAEERGLDLDQLTNPDVEPTEQQRHLMADVADALQAAGLTAAIDYLIRIPTWLDFIDAYARTAVNFVAGMPEGVYRDVVVKLSAATRDGMNPFERARIVRNFLSMDTEGGYDQWMVRARRIARTETNRAVNAADMHAARAEQDITGDDMHKVWVCTIDARTRDSHWAADGQRVPLGAKFDIGGFPADHPGDPTLPAHECINCRCTTILLRADEPLPGEHDRQTERERADVTRRNPHDEVRRRAERGVTRDRDTEPVLAALGGTLRTQFSSILAPLDIPTGDGRIFDKDADIRFREMPLPLLFQKQTSNGHDTAVVVGKITDAAVDGGNIHATGEFLDTPAADEAKQLADEGLIRPSVDLADMTINWVVVDGDGNEVDPEEDEPADDWREIMHVRSAEVIAATLVSKPAFANTNITLGDTKAADKDEDEEVEALTAAAVAVLDRPTVDSAAFANPNLEGPTALTVTDDGHVYGHLALWGTEHVGIGRGVTPPHSKCDYAMFHVSTVDTDTGPVSCGRLTVGCGHAAGNARANAAAEHYDQTGTCWALVRAGEDKHGIWVAGVVNPDADEAAVRAGASAPLSGDWRQIGGNLELVAALSVNTPGFPVPRTYSATRGEELSLVAAAVVPRRSKADELADAVAEGLARHERRKELAAQQEQQRAAEQERATRRRSLAATMLARRIGGDQ